MPRGKKSEGLDVPKRPPAMSPEAQENRMIALAIDLAEKQLKEGTASSQVITHYLKLGTMKEKLELEKLRKENALIDAKTDDLRAVKRVEELVVEALDAMQRYSGNFEECVEGDDDYYNVETWDGTSR